METRRTFMTKLGLGLVAVLVVKPEAATATTLEQGLRRNLNGLEPDKLSSNCLRILDGSFYDSVNNACVSFTTRNEINLNNTGLLGLDTGSPSNGELYVYIVSNGSDYSFVASKEKFQSDVVCPVGFSVVRKLPWGVMYNTAWGGIPNFHLTHWPRPMLTLTDSEATSKWAALGAGNATEWTTVDLSKWVPDNARLVHITCQVRGTSGAGSAYLRSHGGQEIGQLVGSVGAGGYNTQTVMIRVDSLRRLQYRVNSSNVQLYIYVLGYSMSEPA